jgi:hypothetical protein
MFKHSCVLSTITLLLHLHPSSLAPGSVTNIAYPRRVADAAHFIQCRRKSAFVFQNLASGHTKLRAALDTRYGKIMEKQPKISSPLPRAQDQIGLPTLTVNRRNRVKFHGRPQFREPVEIPAMEEHTATVIYLHGFGSDGPGRGKDLPELLNLPWVKYLVPIAPVRRLQIGQATQSWATIDPVDSITRQAQILASAAGRLFSGESQVGHTPYAPPHAAPT